MQRQEHEDLLLRFRPLVESIARSYGNNGAEFNDLVQEGYLAILELLPRCRNRQYLAKFLKWRVRARVRARAAKWWNRPGKKVEFDPEKHSPHYEEALPWTRWVAEQTLPERDSRIVLLLAEGFTQQEIADSLGVTQQAVSFRVGRIREKLQKNEEADGGSQDAGNT